jgi:transcriptional regulator
MLPKEVNQARKIEVLSNVGLTPTEIASILGTTPNTVSVTLYDLKKKKASVPTKPQSKVEIPQQTLASEQNQAVTDSSSQA